jgi:YfiH family protein
MLTHDAWSAVGGLAHGFLDRTDSEGERWEAIVVRLGAPCPLALPRQVHGIRVVDGVAGARPEADALVARRPGLLVGVVTADCVPVLLVDRDARTAAAVHAGWRGMAAGVLETALAALSSARIEALIGPAIGGCCYEVGDEVRAAFRARTGSVTAAAWTIHGGRTHVDLRTAARLLLESGGAASVQTLGPCTRCDSRYHSFRRDGARTGRQLSFVGWA